MASRPRSLTVALPPVPESARRARRALVQGGLDPDLDHTVNLLTSEIVTNSVRHCRVAAEIRLEAVLEDGFARVAVIDQGPGFDPDVRHQANGFGLRARRQARLPLGRRPRPRRHARLVRGRPPPPALRPPARRALSAAQAARIV